MELSFLEPVSSPTRKPPAHLGAESAPTVVEQLREAYQAWLDKSPSLDTRSNYKRDIEQFMTFVDYPSTMPELLLRVRPGQVAAWRDQLREKELANSSIRRKLTVLRSLFSFFQSCGYSGVNPAHSDFVAAPAVPRDGKTVGLSPDHCRRLLDAPAITMKKINAQQEALEIPLPRGIRDRALFAILAYTGCRVGELTRLRVASYQQNGVHRVLEVMGKGGKERLVPLHPEAAERLEAWLVIAGIKDGPLFRPMNAARGNGATGFAEKPMTRRAVQKLVETYVRRLKLDPNVTVHSLRVTALTTAREQGSDIIDLQDFAGHADPRTTLTYIRNRDRLSKSPAYLLKY